MIVVLVVAGVMAGTYIVATNLQVERQRQEAYNSQVLKRKPRKD